MVTNDRPETPLIQGAQRMWLQTLFQELETKRCTVTGILEDVLNIGNSWMDSGNRGLVEIEGPLGSFE